VKVQKFVFKRVVPAGHGAGKTNHAAGVGSQLESGIATTWQKKSDPPTSAELVPVMAQDVASPEPAYTVAGFKEPCWEPVESA